MRPVLTSLLLLGILTPWAHAQQAAPGAPPAAPYPPAQTRPVQARPVQAPGTPTSQHQQQMAGRPARINAPAAGKSPQHTPATPSLRPAASHNPLPHATPTTPPAHKASAASLVVHQPGVHQPGAVEHASHEVALKPTSPPGKDASIPLDPPTKSDIPLSPPSTEKGGGKKTSSGGSGPAITSMLGSLAVVVGLFLAVAWFARRAGGQSSTALPKEVVQVLGRTPLTSKQNLQVIRFGNKMLLVSVTAGGAETLAELTDGAEIDRIAGLCQQQGSESVTASFRQMMSQMSREPASRTAASTPAPTPAAPAARKQSAQRAASSRAASAYTSTGR